MDTLLSLALAAAGLGLVAFSAERLVKGVVGTSVGFGLSVFVISVVFIGFDPGEPGGWRGGIVRGRGRHRAGLGP